MANQDPDYLDGRAHGSYDVADGRARPRDNPYLDREGEARTGRSAEAQAWADGYQSAWDDDFDRRARGGN